MSTRLPCAALPAGLCWHFLLLPAAFVIKAAHSHNPAKNDQIHQNGRWSVCRIGNRNGQIMIKSVTMAGVNFAGLGVEGEHRQAEDIGQDAAEAAPAPPVSTTNTGSAAAAESTPARRDSIKRNLSRTIAGKRTHPSCLYASLAACRPCDTAYKSQVCCAAAKQ